MIDNATLTIISASFWPSKSYAGVLAIPRARGRRGAYDLTLGNVPDLVQDLLRHLADLSLIVWYVGALNGKTLGFCT